MQKTRRLCMLDCLGRMSCKSCLESLDWIPLVSTASNLIHIFARYACDITPRSSYGSYLYSRPIEQNYGLLVPFYNVYLLSKQKLVYRIIPTTEIEMASVATVQERRAPKLRLDEVVITLGSEKNNYHTSFMGSCFIKDKDIASKLPYVKDTEDGVRLTSSGKAIIQQNALLSATAACIEMLCWDHGKSAKFEEPEDFNTTQSLIRKFQSRGLNARVSKIPQAVMLQPDLLAETLRHYIFLKGSLIIGLDTDEIGPHAIIIDEVSECLKYFRIRDPYHGWEITIKRKAVLKKLQNKLIQVDRS